MQFKDESTGQRLGRLVNPLFMLYARFSRGMTLGSRVAVLDGKGGVFLVKHTYVPGWHLPGGGVDPGETVEQAALRELREEGAIRARDLVFRGLYQNRDASVRDHVAFFVTGTFEQDGPRPPDREIADCGFFPLDDLPDDSTPATRRRVDELAGRRQPDGYW